MFSLSSLVSVLPLQRYNFEIVIVTDTGSASAVQRALARSLHRGKFAPFKESDIKVVVEDRFLSSGDIQQKYSKLTSDLVTDADYILHLDSDVHYSGWDDRCFFGSSGLPRLDYASWKELPKSASLWKHGTEVLLNISQVKYEFSRANQHIYPRRLYKLLRDRVELVAKKDFRSVFVDYPLFGSSAHRDAFHFKWKNTSQLVSDFNMLGATAHYLAPGLMQSNHVGKPGSEPLHRCTHHCNTRLVSVRCCESWFKALTQFRAAGGTLSRFDCQSDFPDSNACGKPSHCDGFALY